MLKKYLRKIVPPFIYDLKKNVGRSKPKNKVGTLFWRGNFGSWEEAEAESMGYDADIIFKKTAESILKVKNGEASFERDSVIFDKPEYSWPLLAMLLKIAMEKDNVLNLLDFGGSLGSSYFQNKHFLSGIGKMYWSVVEQEHYINFGNEKIADNSLKFYFNIEDCIKERNPSVLLLSGVIQCMNNPYEWLEKFISKDFEYIIFDRTAFIEADEDRLTVQEVPPIIYQASYPAWFFNYGKFVNFFKGRYTVIADFEAHHGFVIKFENNEKAYYKGLILQKI